MRRFDIDCSDLADKSGPQQGHQEKHLVVNDVSPGGHPNVLGQFHGRVSTIRAEPMTTMH
jgi:hypothetical protein